MNASKISSLYFLFLISIFSLVSCETEEPTVNTGDPSNLSLEAIVTDDNSGKVSFQAIATDAILYEFDLGTIDSDTGSSEDGLLEFVYENSGVYTVSVKAYGNSGRFVTATTQINVTSGEPSTAGVGYTTPISYDDMNLLWSDEFDGTLLNQSIWSYDNGNGCPDLCGWGNNELEYYRAENSWVSNGALTIEARAETFNSNEYTSTKIKTQGKKAFLYGRVDVRAKMPAGKGLWPAIWMLGQNINTVSWPSCGEIDIMEMVGGNGREKISHGTAHWTGSNGYARDGDDISVALGLDQVFHVYSILWNETRIQWLLDDVPYYTLNITGPDEQEFHKPFFMILNVAVGGDWPGSPNAETAFPTQMKVDYVRVFQDK